MKFIPILFSTPMVQAIIDGRKTQTRRMIDLKTCSENFSAIIGGYNNIPKMARFYKSNGDNNPIIEDIKLRYNIGDVLWVRETWRYTDFLHPEDENNGYIYKASENGRDWESHDDFWIWKPSIHMPKDACRLFLQVKSVKVERLQDIKSSDAIKEGIEYITDRGALNGFKNYINDTCTFADHLSVDSFCSLWKKINGKESWESNPWVWVIEFERIEKPDSFL